MKYTFADTSFYQALVNPSDAWHVVALELSKMCFGSTVTSEYVLLELGALMARGTLRPLFVDLVQQLRADPENEIVAASSGLFEAGLDLFGRRPDKNWSLTDCISFSLMEQRGINAVLTFDRHFSQAGFNSLQPR